MRKFILSLFCVILLFSSLLPCYSVMADTNKCTVTVASIKGNIGDTVYLPISIENNPGISGVSISVTYNSKALTYKGYTKGPVFTDSFMVQDHPTKNLIRLVLVESSKDSTNNGNIITLKFTIGEDTAADFYPISIDYGSGDFANRKMGAVMPEIVSGGVEVIYNPAAQNCAHKNYGEWLAVAEPTCTAKGIEQRECTLCGHKDTRETEKTAHVYEDEWTVDTPATKERDGVMTRHCKHCTATTDRITFKYEDPQDEDFENSIGTEVPKNDYTENLFNEQHPDKELTRNESYVKTESSSPASTVSKITTTSSKTETTDNESEINSTNSQVSVSKDEDFETVASESTAEENQAPQNRLVFIIIGIILLVILLAIIAIVACQKTKN